MYDCIIAGGRVVDGNSDIIETKDVAIRGGRIIAVGDVTLNAKDIIDARGKVVSPGFIDIHRHADFAALREDFGRLELAQGLTTIVNGNCGLSVSPIDGPYHQAVVNYLRPITGPIGADAPTDSMAHYLKTVEDSSPRINTRMLVGAGTVRASVAGYDIERLSSDQIRRIQEILKRSLAEGAIGISLGLGYAPECFYTTQELTEVLRPFGGSDTPVTVHMREEGDGVLDALEEMLTIAKTLNLRVHISHLKAMGRRNWNMKIPRALEMLERARQDGLRVDCDAYPYTAGSTQFIHILPPDFLVGGIEGVSKRLKDPEQRRILTERIKTGTDFDNIAGMIGWENIVCATLEKPENKPFIGKSVAEIASIQGKDPFDAAYDLLTDEHCEITMIDFINSEEDIRRILKDRHAAVISDATYPVEGTPHPRLYGTFPRIIEKYVCQEGLLSLEEAVYKMSALPAQMLGLKGKGRIAEGYDADICVFDPANIREMATYDNPRQYAQGMDYVFVNGVPALYEGGFVEPYGARSEDGF